MLHPVDGPIEDERTGGRGVDSTSKRAVWAVVVVTLVAGWIVAVVNGAWVSGAVLIPMAVVVFWLGRRAQVPAAPVEELSFAWGMDEIPQGPAMRELALRRIRDRKSIRRAFRESMRAMSPRERRQAKMGMAMGVACFVVIGWQALTRTWTPYFVLAAASIGLMQVLLLIGWLMRPIPGWLRREDARAREDRMLRSWTPRGLERRFRWNMVPVGVSLMTVPIVVLAVWIAPRLGIGVLAAWSTLANSLFVYALGLLLGGFVAPIAIVFQGQTATYRRQRMVVAEAVLWAPEDGVDEDGAMERGVV